MQTDDYQSFASLLGAQIQSVRISLGFLQEDVAQMIGISRVAVGYIEQGRRSPKLSTLYDMANLFEVDIRLFFAFLDNEDASITPPPRLSKN